ncbi:Putative chloride channel-like protein CLC-g [Triticum urartu]|uniref:Chloride channel protein n=1 Tax=Triticum urartu TaxID=4572 RepID=M7ZB44_TRIUA|nr:Putative chloride channel-like protein CLC-g [Triticum urartu]
MASTAPPREDLITEDEEQRPPLTRPLLRRSATNNISQVAMVGSKACPIESLDYEIIENDLFDQNWRTRAKADQVWYVVLKWTFCFAIGIITGVVGFLINLAVENVAGFKHAAVSSLMDSTSYWTAFWVFAGANLALLLLASAITASVSPAAGGSGIPEVKAYLNGVDAPNIFSLKTLAVKVIGNIAAVSSSLHVGKAGPMVHTGACIAAIFGQGGSRSARIWRSFFAAAVVAVVLRLFVELCGSGRCGLFGKGGLIMYDVSTLFEDLMTYHLKDIPIVVLIGVIGAVLGAFYNFLMARRRSPPRGAHRPPCGSLNKFRRFHCPPDHYNDLASLMLNINDDAIRNLYATGTNDVYHRGSMLAFFVASYALGVLSYGVVAPSGLFVPIILTGATYGRLVAMLLGRHSGLDHGLVAILGSASFLGGTLRMTVSVCVIIVELTNNLLLLPLVMLVLLISKTVADSFNASIYDLIVRLKGLPYLDGHAEPYMRQLSVGDVVVGPLRSFNGVEKVGHIMHVLRTTGHHAFPVIDEPPFATAPVLYGLVLRAHLLVLLRKREFLPAQERYPKEYSIAARFEAQDFDKRGSGKQDTVDGVELSPEEMEMYVDLHPFTNASPYTVVETMSLAKALILFREVGLRHLLVVPKACDRSPVVGILTRHDFMPEHILGLHPVLLGGKWKRLRWHKAAVAKYFRDLIVRLANCG